MTLLTATTTAAAAVVTIFLSQPIVATDLVTAQVEDTVTLQPVLPASGLSACPGQDVTLNCTIVRMTTLSGVTPPLLPLHTTTHQLAVTTILLYFMLST